MDDKKPEMISETAPDFDTIEKLEHEETVTGQSYGVDWTQVRIAAIRNLFSK